MHETFQLRSNPQCLASCDAHLDQLSINHVIYLDLCIHAANADIWPTIHGIHRPRAATASGFILGIAEPSSSYSSVEVTYIVVSYDIDHLAGVSFIWVLCQSTDDHLIERIRELVSSHIYLETTKGTSKAVRLTCFLLIAANTGSWSRGW